VKKGKKIRKAWK